MTARLLDITPTNYQKHSLHNEDAAWSETNCYVDLWIELLHSMDLDPIAALAFTLTIDFEGDQWTFFKYPIEDLDKLYGLDVQELNIWRSLKDCIEVQMRMGRHVLVELDSFYLPDTQGTAYKREHVKTTVGINEFNIDTQYMAYFHNQGYFELSGDDFHQLFLSEERDKHVLPPYVEFVKHRSNRPNEEELIEHSIQLFKKHVSNIPNKNPFKRFKDAFANDFSDLSTIDLDFFHKYSFASFRQYGACFELSKTYLQWLTEKGFKEQSLFVAIERFEKISENSKIIQFQLARSVKRNKPLDLKLLDETITDWDVAMGALTQSITSD